MHVRDTFLRPVGFAAMTGVLAFLVACGGSGSSSVSGPKLSYINPTSSSYRLVADPTSTASHLVLSLVGPSGAQIQGTTVSLNADASKVTWTNPGGADPYVLQGAALSLGTGTPLLKSKLAGPVLQTAVFQKGAVAPATLGTQAILSVALDLKAGAAKGPVKLSSVTAQILDASGTTQTISVAVGSLSAE
jgi:hypothetical protein